MVSVSFNTYKKRLESLTTYDRTMAIIDINIATNTEIENPNVNSGTLSIEKLFPGAPDERENIVPNKAVPIPQPK